MTAGIETKDPSTGTINLTVGDRVSRIIGSFNTGTAAGSFSDPGLATGTPWACAVGYGSASTSSSNVPPIITFVGTTLSWTAPSVNTFVLYGVY